MLIRFKSPAHHEVLMFGAIAEQLLGMMGCSGRIPSALQDEELLIARQRLATALSAQAENRIPVEDDEDQPAPVSLRHRALPLLAMLDAAAARKTWLLWEKAD